MVVKRPPTSRFLPPKTPDASLRRPESEPKRQLLVVDEEPPEPTDGTSAPSKEAIAAAAQLQRRRGELPVRGGAMTPSTRKRIDQWLSQQNARGGGGET
jgi:hypothetical protein